jgi:hypothetical protein
VFSESSNIPKYSKQVVGPTVLCRAYYFYTRLCFGCRSSPNIIYQLSVAICWILQNNYYMKHVLHLLDDFLVIDEPSFNAEIIMQRLLNVLEN